MSDDVALTLGGHVAGWLGVIGVLAPLALGAWRLRRAVLPDWAGATARLAEIILVLAGLLLPAQLLGATDRLHASAVLAAAVVTGAAMAALGVAVDRRPPVWTARRADDAAAVPPPEPRVEVGAAVAAVGLMATQWIAHTLSALTHGMSQPDTLWYHGPFAARFVQQGSFTGIDDLGYESARYFPFNSELTHALTLLAFGHDVLSPALNLGWAALVLLAAWCIGHRAGVGALSVTAATVVLVLPTVVGVEPGQASNDLPCAALLLAAVALILHEPLAPVPTLLAAVATGLGLGVKLTGGGVVLALTIGVVALALRARRPTTALIWCAGLAVSGGYWFVRNWRITDNPVPWFGFELGPVSLPRVTDEGSTALVDGMTKGALWRNAYLPGLAEGFGVVWPIVVGLTFAAIAVPLVRGTRPAERLIGFVVLAGALTYVVTPLTGGPGFVWNLRYLAPTMLVGFSVLPLFLARAGARVRSGVALGLLALVGLCLAFHPGAMLPAWPADHVAVGVATAVAALAVTGAAIAAARALRPGRALRVAGVAVLVVVGVAVAWPVEQRFLEHRYVAAGLEGDAVNAYFRDVHDARVAVFGTGTYPMFGLDLSNVAEQVEVPPGAPAGAERCRRTLSMLQQGYRYVVLTPVSGFVATIRPDERWFADDPTFTEVARDGQSVAFRVDGRPDLDRCAR